MMFDKELIIDSFAATRPNLATAFLMARNESLDDWDGLCVDLAGEVAGYSGRIVYVEPSKGTVSNQLLLRGWKWHAAALIDGFIHDAWSSGPAVPLIDWVRSMFAGDLVEVTLDGNELLHDGPAETFTIDTMGVA